MSTNAKTLADLEQAMTCADCHTEGADGLYERAVKERDEARREADRFRHGCTVEGDFACPSEYAVSELTAERDEARAEVERLRGIVPELPPFGSNGLPRYGLRWDGPSEPLAEPLEDGYWTPWHLADEAIHDARAQLAALDTGAPCDGHRHCCADRRRLAEELLRVRAERDALRDRP